MAYIKKLVMNGFKSFGRKTEILFDKGINVILGPNGSGKSNVTDALCFVLGKRSAKAMRATQAKNLVFMGSKYAKPAREAIVELVFDNSDRAFSLDKDEIVLARILRRNGQSIYKINNETKTLNEIVEMLAQAGIYPDGFNMILQGQIQSIVKMHPDERRKIIEDVAGIAIYESRKEKSLHELEKTDEKLKEITAVLRERTAYLRNLDKEREQALKFKDLELTIKRAKASILHKRNEEKKKEVEKVDSAIANDDEKREKKRAELQHKQSESEDLNSKITQINKSIQQATGLEQGNLRNTIANLKAEIEVLKVRKENFESRKNESEKRISELTRNVPELEKEIALLKEKSPKVAKKNDELKKKREELGNIEEERKKVNSLKSELNATKERIKDKEKALARVMADSESNLKNLEDYSINLAYKSEEECKKSIEKMKDELSKKRIEVNEINSKEIELERSLSVHESDIDKSEDIKKKVNTLDVCPLCQSKITKDHINHVFTDSNLKIKNAKDSIEKTRTTLSEIKDKRRLILEEIRSLDEKKSSSEMELIRHRTIFEKKEFLKRLVNEEKIARNELEALEEKRKSLEQKTLDVSKIEERYHAILLEIDEISSRNEEDVDNTISYKQRELEGIENAIKVAKRDLTELGDNIEELKGKLSEKVVSLEVKDKQERELNERFKKMFDERDRMQADLQEINFTVSEIQSDIRQIEDQTNYLRIGKAKLDAEREGIEAELTEYSGIELIQGSMNYLDERLKKAQESLTTIGSINLRALEVYDEIKKEYDAIQDKVNTLEQEKTQIMEIIAEIDKKKKSAFMKTFRAMNELFTRNFAQLYTKGIAYLEIENKEDIFAGGVNIIVRLAKGKYFDVTSLSGGEQTLVALSLLFAIQEYKPYHFYIFDEIDAALDKRNSERLAGLLTQYMKSGQYIVVTHNDSIITNSNVLYGVSMHDGVSKVLSLKI